MTTYVKNWQPQNIFYSQIQAKACILRNQLTFTFEVKTGHESSKKQEHKQDPHILNTEDTTKHEILM